MVRKIPVFTFPFILVTWLFLTLFHYFPALVQPQPLDTAIHANSYLALCSHGFGQVIFQDNIAAGILFIIGVLIGRPIAALFGIISIALSSILSFLLKVPTADIFLGLLGYNAVLCAITFAGNKWEDILLSLLAVSLSVMIMIQMRHLDIPALTFPFVLSSWLTLIIKTLRQSVALKLKQ
jgi:urea transporter